MAIYIHKGGRKDTDEDFCDRCLIDTMLIKKIKIVTRKQTNPTNLVYGNDGYAYILNGKSNLHDGFSLCFSFLSVSLLALPHGLPENWAAQH